MRLRAMKKQTQYKPNLSLPKGDQTQYLTALRSVAQSYGLLTEDKFHRNDILNTIH